MVTDEGHIITTNPLLAPYVVKIVKMWRKLGAWYWIATQNLEDFPDAAKRLLNMIEWWLCLVSPKEEIDQIARFKALTPEQKQLLLSARKEPGLYTEGVVLADTVEALFRSVPPPLYLALAMTEKDEKAAATTFDGRARHFGSRGGDEDCRAIECKERHMTPLTRTRSRSRLLGTGADRSCRLPAMAQLTINRLEIAARSVSLQCLNYAVEGVCVWLDCSPVGCSLVAVPRIRHFSPGRGRQRLSRDRRKPMDGNEPVDRGRQRSARRRNRRGSRRAAAHESTVQECRCDRSSVGGRT